MINVAQLSKKNKNLVSKKKVDIGISLDGDADRIIVCDENSKIIDGDQIIAMLASRWKKKKNFERWCCRDINVKFWFRNFL